MDFEFYLNFCLQAFMFLVPFNMFLIILNIQSKKELIKNLGSKEIYKTKLNEQKKTNSETLIVFNALQILLIIIILIAPIFLMKNLLLFAVCFIALFLPEICQQKTVATFFVALPIYILIILLFVSITLGKSLHIKSKIKQVMLLEKK